MEKRTFAVEGMACEHCKANVEKALMGLRGVKGAAVSLETKSVTVEYDSANVTPQEMREAVDEAGYEMTI